MNWFNQYAAAIQALAALGVVLLTAFLVWATLRYANLTAQSLQLTRDQFERQWHVDIRLTLLKESPRVAALQITNLSVPPAFLQNLTVRVNGEPPSQETNYPLNKLIAGTHSESIDIYEQLIKSLVNRGLISSAPKEGAEWAGDMAINVSFFCGAKWGEAGPLKFRLSLHYPDVVAIAAAEWSGVRWYAETVPTSAQKNRLSLWLTELQSKWQSRLQNVKKRLERFL